MKLSPAGRNTGIQPPHKGYRTIGYADKMWLYVDDAIKKHLEKKKSARYHKKYEQHQSVSLC